MAEHVAVRPDDAGRIARVRRRGATDLSAGCLRAHSSFRRDCRKMARLHRQVCFVSMAAAPQFGGGPGACAHLRSLRRDSCASGRALPAGDHLSRFVRGARGPWRKSRLHAVIHRSHSSILDSARVAPRRFHRVHFVGNGGRRETTGRAPRWSAACSDCATGPQLSISKTQPDGGASKACANFAARSYGAFCLARRHQYSAKKS